MTLALHQNTSNAAGYRKSLEGWARAGIKDVEITNVLLDDFLKIEDLAAAKRSDHRPGPEPGSEPQPALRNSGSQIRIGMAASRQPQRKRCEMYANMGLNRVYASTACSKSFTDDDYEAAPDNMYEAGDVAKQFQCDAED